MNDHTAVLWKSTSQIDVRRDWPEASTREPTGCCIHELAAMMK